MKHGSLFSGIGGFDLAAEWMGWENVFHCEWNDFGKKILKYYWPNAISYDDITKTDFTIHRGSIDILTGGFPCQPFSAAGVRRGKDDERYLWPEMLRAIREIQPRWIVGENVYGLVNWSRGLVFYEVQADLEAAGYEVQPFLLPAAAVNAPHRRDRIWFVAYRNATNTDGFRLEQCENGTEMGGGQSQMGRKGSKFTNAIETNGKVTDAADTNGNGLERSISTDINRKFPSKEKYDEECISTYWGGIQFQNFPTVPPVCHGNDGLSSQLDSITFPKWRQESIKGGGNAVVSQLVYMIFKTIKEYEKNK